MKEGRKEGFYLKKFNRSHVIAQGFSLKDGRKEMFYSMMHSTHFIYGYMASDICKGRVLFNDALNTFYLRLYGGEGMKGFI